MAENVYVFDTNIVSSLLHERQRLLLTRIQQNQSDSLILCEPVIYEIERGLNHKQARYQLNRFRNEIFPLFTTIPIQLTDWRAAAVLWAYAKKRGRQLSDIDLLLGAITVRLGGILITDDKDFAHLPAVPTENWL
jgi:predicted nucleic acid-binding protein